MDAKSQKAAFNHGKELIKARLEVYLDGRREVGLEDVKRDLHNNCRARVEFSQSGLFIAKLLNGVGWRRDGQRGAGYDRQPRYTRMDS